MSAESPRRGVHKGAQVVSPQPISDHSIIDSVAGIINDIVPQAYTGTPNTDNEESIAWARFEYADVNDFALYPDYNEGSEIPPLLLVLGYGTGVQVWLVAASGEATEVISWRQGIVRTLRVLPNPKNNEDHTDLFAVKRPMVAICDSAGPGPQFCNVSFISLRTGEQTKSIKFKNPVCDILANRRSVVVTFLERIAVFDAGNLEDVITVTTCYPSPGPNPNPVALGTRWLAYSEKKLLPARRSSGGSEGEGVQSYTATVLYAAKSLGKGLRGLGETVASSLTGNSVTPMIANNAGGDCIQPGVVTILDLQAAKDDRHEDKGPIETVVAHFTAHNDAIVAMNFDQTGALLMTADKRGHDFHVFRIQPHPGGPTLAAVHHLYVLHRGDTTAKVQDMTFSNDARWAAVSTVRGTTHVFPVAPYGGPVGVRTHSTPHVVNRLSRFHRSAGLTDDGTRSHSPVSHTEPPLSVYPYSNPRLPPYPHPTILHPLAQIRQPSTLNHPNSQTQTRPQQRQRLHSDDGGSLPLKICACFAPPRAWIYAQRDSSSKMTKRAVDSLFVMACHGNMIQYDLEPKPAAGVPKEKICDDTMIELEVEAKGQWPLLRSPGSSEVIPPLPPSSPFLGISSCTNNSQAFDTAEDRWLSQVEIVTHAGPHRRLWMGPQFVFKTYNAPSGVAVNLAEAEAVEVGVTAGSRPARSNPVNMPHAAARPLVPVVIDGSGSSYEQSPRFLEAYGDSLDNDTMGVGGGENQLREHLAEAMLETSATPHRVPGRRVVVERVGQPVTKVVNPLGTVITVTAEEEEEEEEEEDDEEEEEAISSSEMFDAKSALEPPRSLCAEEGPASLSDFEPEGQALRNLTEICAEMRSASEPAFDSVPDDSIKDVKERKALFVEAARIDVRSAINIDRVEIFRDVPTSLSLCAESGEIPSSPMTRAKETAWNRRAKGDAELHESNFGKIKYLVNYDEESVVLMENKTTCEKSAVLPASSEQEEKILDSTLSETRKCAVKASITELEISDDSKGAFGAEGKEGSRFLNTEQRDGIVLENKKHSGDNARVDRRAAAASGKKRIRGHNKGAGPENPQEAEHDSISISGLLVPRKPRETFSKDKSTRSKDKAKSRETKKAIRTDSIGSAEEIGTRAIRMKEIEPTEIEGCCIESPCSALQNSDAEQLHLKALPIEDFSSIDYDIVERQGCPDRHTAVTSSNHSDEDIEHIDSSEVTQIPELGSKGLESSEDRLESWPTWKRKGSKSTISDDDMEHIHSLELSRLEPALGAKATRHEVERSSEEPVRSCRNVVSSDDDMEHVLHSEVSELQSAVGYVLEGNRATAEVDVENGTTSKSVMSDMRLEKLGSIDNIRDSFEEKSGSSSSRRREAVVIVESDFSEPDVTLVRPSEGRSSKCRNITKNSRNRSPEKKDLTVKLEKVTDRRAWESSRNSKVKSKAIQKTSSESIEIIDIDAMQQEESVLRCKILEVKSKKFRKNKKPLNDADLANETGHSKLSPFEESRCDTTAPRPLEKTIPESHLTNPRTALPIASSWSSVVKKKSPVTSKEQAAIPTGSSEISAREEEGQEQREQHEQHEQHEHSGNTSQATENYEKVDRDKAEELKPAAVSESNGVNYSDIKFLKGHKKSRNYQLSVDSRERIVPRETANFEVDSAIYVEKRKARSKENIGTVEDTEKEKEKEEAEVEVVMEEEEEEEEDEEDEEEEDERANILKTDGISTEGTADGEIESLTELERSAAELEVGKQGAGKRSDSEPEMMPEQSSSTEELNANATLMDTTLEEDNSTTRDNAETVVANGGIDGNGSSSSGKKGKPKKKKRR
ncbi:uncharacterized protein LOC107268137 isoform X2 [Cephus cinctus]|uniref:Uncharacterized protein LOC107268137 isoform X2 n=1 Tax=Cephus cinctus TaxID=211228 RepID=A0AAJ7RHU8_CEPCN|nr:uncharacterized protein LOC107268137 isoform X2 [Cephus cinctus]